MDPRQPLGYAGFAAQKNYYSLYLGARYYGGGVVASQRTPDHDWFVKEWRRTGKKLDMGLCCVRFRKLEDLPLDLVGRAMARFPVKTLVEWYEAAIRNLPPRRKKGKPRRTPNS